MECTLDWQGPDGMLFISRTGSGHVLAMDGAPDGGGHNLAARPWKPCWPAQAAAPPMTSC